MAFDSEGLFSGLILNACVFLILYIVGWYLWRTSRVGGVLLYKVFRPKRPLDGPTFWHFRGYAKEVTGWLASIYKLQDPWIDCNQGPEAQMYLIYLRLMIGLFASIGVVCPLLLIPINATADYREQQFATDASRNLTDASFYEAGVADWTTRNLEPKTLRLWGLTIVSMYVSYEVWGLVLKLTRELRTMRGSLIPPATAQMFNIPGDTRLAATLYILRKIPKELKPHVKHVVVPEEAPKAMLDLISKRQTAQDELRYWYAYCQKEHISLANEAEWAEHPDLVIRPKVCGEYANAIMHFRQEVNDIEDELERLAAYVNNKDTYNLPLGTGFVTFHSPEACALFVAVANSGTKLYQKVVRAVPGLYQPAVWFAPPPYCVIWQNLGLHRAERFGRKLALYTILIGLGSVWSAIIGVLGNVDNLAGWIYPVEEVMNIHPEVRGLASAYLPVLTLAILKAILPIALRPIITFLEKPSDKTQREVRLMQCMTTFIIITSVLIQSALQGGGDSLSIMSDRSFRELLVQMIVPSNGYFVLQVVSAAFIGNMVSLLKPIDVILGALLNVMALTQRDVDEAYEKRPFFFSEEYSSSLVNFAFAFLFCVNVPYIPFFGFFYFWIKFLVDRALLTDAYPCCRVSGLECAAVTIKSIMFILIAFQSFAVIALLFILERYDCAIAACGPLVATLILFVKLSSFLRHIMGPKFLKTGDEYILELPRMFDILFGSAVASAGTAPDAQQHTAEYAVVDVHDVEAAAAVGAGDTGHVAEGDAGHAAGEESSRKDAPSSYNPPSQTSQVKGPIGFLPPAPVPDGTPKLTLTSPELLAINEPLMGEDEDGPAADEQTAREREEVRAQLEEAQTAEVYRMMYARGLAGMAYQPTVEPTPPQQPRGTPSLVHGDGPEPISERLVLPAATSGGEHAGEEMERTPGGATSSPERPLPRRPSQTSPGRTSGHRRLSSTPPPPRTQEAAEEPETEQGLASDDHGSRRRSRVDLTVPGSTTRPASSCGRSSRAQVGKTFAEMQQENVMEGLEAILPMDDDEESSPEEVPSEEVSVAPESAEESDEKWIKIIEGNGISDYEHPCTLFACLPRHRTNHEREAQKPWLVAHDLDTSKPSRYILQPCVFFPGPEIEEVEPLLPARPHVTFTVDDKVYYPTDSDATTEGSLGDDVEQFEERSADLSPA